METVHEEYNTEKQSPIVRFCLWAKGFDVKDINKEMFPAYGEKCLSRKAVHSCVEEFSQGGSKVVDDETETRKWLRQQTKDFYAAGFGALMKRWEKCINVGGGYVEKHMFFFQV
jgi:hypothetical protein